MATENQRYTTELRDGALHVINREVAMFRATRAVKGGSVQMHYLSAVRSLRGALYLIAFVPEGGAPLTWNQATRLGEANRMFDNLVSLHEQD